MGRIGISYSEVVEVATELQSRGINPTVDAVRECLKTGSRSTIGPYLKQWRTQNEINLNTQNNAKGLPTELYSLTKGLYDRLQEEAEIKIKKAEDAARAEIDEIQKKLDQTVAGNAALAKEIQGLDLKIHEFTALSSQLKSELDNEQKQNLSLSSKNQELEIRLQDKIEQIQVLEKQLNNVQSNLEHYRESTNAQREKDKQTWERETSILNQEIKRLTQQHQFIEKANHDLSNKLEIASAEKQQLQTEWHENKGKIMELQEQLKTKDSITKDLENRYCELTKEHQKIMVQLSQLQAEHYQLEKEDLILRERLQSADNLIRRSEDTISNLQNERLFLVQEVSSLKSELKKLEKAY